LLEIIHEWDMMRIRDVLEVGGVDIIGHRGWYEGVFFSPKLFERFIAPLLKEEVEAAHRAGAKFGYIITRGLMPLLKDIKELGLDLIWGIDPIQDVVDLNLVKREVGNSVCLWGGMNSYVTLQEEAEAVKKAVQNAIHALAPDGGFILSAVDAVLEEIPIEGLRNMIRAWREYADYPVSII
jgi:uroporphyrinogen decarboxylase